MSTKERAYQIIDSFTEKQLENFVAFYSASTFNSDNGDNSSDKQKAFYRLENLIRHIPDLDDKKELAEYREEKYGNESAD